MGGLAGVLLVGALVLGDATVDVDVEAGTRTSLIIPGHSRFGGQCLTQGHLSVCSRLETLASVGVAHHWQHV